MPAFARAASLLAVLLVPSLARAQTCNISLGPALPPPVTGFSNMSFGATSPLAPYVLSSEGINGCGGSNATGPDQQGGTGSPGQAGGTIVGVNTGLTFVGGGFPNPSFMTDGAAVGAAGGSAGGGGFGGANFTHLGQGGVGGAGGAGGTITLQFDAKFVPDASGNFANRGVFAQANGGIGGQGGTTSNLGFDPTFAGAGGAGGAGGQVTVTVSGSVAVSTVGVLANTLGGDGGVGGAGPQQFLIQNTTGGDGGDAGAGGTSSVQIGSAIIRSGFVGVQALAGGGEGGDGGLAEKATGSFGGNAGNGGNGGTASVQLGSAGEIDVQLPVTDTFLPALGAAYVTANGGAGGGGGRAQGGGVGVDGGSGGNGGNGGSASANVSGTINLGGETGPGTVSGAAIFVQSNGGAGGVGAGGSGAITGEAGGGGFAGNGGSALLTLGDASNTARIATQGNYAHGALVQSVGGAGGAGGTVSFVLAGSGGAGAAGGNGGPVTVTSDHAFVTVGSTMVGSPSGEGSSAIVAQSIGGGGGTGGDASGLSVGFGFQIGGNGGLGGNGGTVQLTLGQNSVFGSLDPSGGTGILAQSIGGSGGNAGNASSTGAAVLTVVIGGDAGSGGVGGQVTINNGALVTTYGDHAAGIKAQSIGGGGGNGGNGTAFNGGAFLSSSVALGGRGGGGGPAGSVSLTNTGQISTYGPDAEGVLLQSIGGGGGTGGSATARAVALSPNPDIPSVSVAFAIGGLGGAGNTGGDVSLNNSGLITTAGHGAIGVFAQSVGGGGGTGGDATAAAYSAAPEEGASLSLSVALGAAGGSGGTGGAVNLTNSGLIATMGQDAYGVFAQSVGGGGGDGGTGDATASSAEAKPSMSVAIAVGGHGGTGGTGGAVSLTNSGSIATVGDGADAVFAQSVGGGGGAAGGGTGTASGGNLAIAVGVGGSGGAGGDGNTVTTTNSGNIVTRGTAATGIFAQSVGGGGGKAGKGGATAGGVTTLSNVQAMFNIVGQGFGLNQKVQTIGDGILQVGQQGEDVQASLTELEGFFPQPQSNPDKQEGTATQINVAVSVGGSGGAGGQGGAVNATNSGAIVTFGAQSHAIFAQSVGGGGGDGGAASSTGSASDDSQVQSAIAVGGSGGAAGSGGAVNVDNMPSGTIETQGVGAFGVFAQSVGGGGGNAALAGVVSGSLKSLSVGVGGNGGAAGNGGPVFVESDGTITTMGKNSVGILAQSVGGGGGVVTTMTTDETFDPSKIINNPQGRLADIHGLALTFGGQNGSSGNGGDVRVVAQGDISTSGLDAHGIVAQSIGGGGGFVLGGQVEFCTTCTSDQAGGGNGNGGQIIVAANGSSILTTGDGAFGVIAQSIGGGGGLAGDPSSVKFYDPITFQVMANSGGGGHVFVTLQNETIETTGRYAPAIFAQSIGGGGGLIAIDDGDGTHEQGRGSAGGAGTGGAISILVLGNSNVLAKGAGSAGILAQSDGSGAGTIQVFVDTGSLVAGGVTDPNFSQNAEQRDASAIRLLGGFNNLITNHGTIQTLGQYAILAYQGVRGEPDQAVSTTVNNSGVINGDIDLGGGNNVVNNLAGGVIDAPTTLNVGGGTVNNAGTLEVGGGKSVGTTLLTGNLVQTPSGVLHVQIDPVNKRSDLLNVTGTASLAGTVVVDATSLLKGSSTVLTAARGIQPGASLSGNSTLIFTFTPVVQSNTVAVATDANFLGASNGSATQKSVAAYLQRLWDSANADFASIFAGFGSIGSASNYAQALTSISGQELVGIAAARYQASQIFARSAFSCPVFVDDTTVRKQDTCVWFRTTGMWDDRSADGSFPGFTWQGTTVKVGGQAELQPGWFLGGAIGYEIDSYNATSNLASAHGNAALGVVALKREIGPWLFTGAVDAGVGWLNSSRTIPIAGAVAKGSSDSFNVGLHVRAAYQIPFADFYLEPALDGDFNDINLPGYTESGAGMFNLKVQTANNVIFTGTPNVRIGTRLQVGSAAVDAYLGAGMSFIAGNSYTTNAHFATAAQGFGDFTNTLKNGTVAGKFSAGVEVYTTSHFDVRLEYDGLVAAQQVENGGQIRLSYRF